MSQNENNILDWYHYYEILKREMIKHDKYYFNHFFIHIMLSLMTIGFDFGISIGQKSIISNDICYIKRLSNQYQIVCMELIGFFD